MSRASITAWDIPMDVEYEYSPAEAGVLWGTPPYPGCPASASLLSVKVGGVDILEMLDDEQIQRIESAVLEYMGEPA
ncbi:MAG: hypothetical protein ACLGIW_18435 [Gammaproteobacteria bacterium]